jgi:hypothetical protein
MKEFDTQKGAFLLVALVIATQMAIILVATAYCAIGILEKALPAGSCREMHQNIVDLFQMSFTAAIAFAGGRMSAPPQPGPRLPPERTDEQPRVQDMAPTGRQVAPDKGHDGGEST